MADFTTAARPIVPLIPYAECDIDITNIRIVP